MRVRGPFITVDRMLQRNVSPADRVVRAAVGVAMVVAGLLIPSHPLAVLLSVLGGWETYAAITGY